MLFLSIDILPTTHYIPFIVGLIVIIIINVMTLKWSIKKEGGVSTKKHIIPGTWWNNRDSYGYEYTKETVPATTGSVLGTLLLGGFINMVLSVIPISLLAFTLAGCSPIRFLVCLGISQLICLLIFWGLIASRHTISYKKAIIAWSYLLFTNLLILGIIGIIIAFLFNTFSITFISYFKSLFSSI